MKYWVDFSGYVSVEADSKEEAEWKMWDAINRGLAFPAGFEDDVWEIEGVEERANFAPPIDVEAFAKDFEDA